MKNAKNTPQPLRRIENSESKLKRLVEIAKILYIGLKEMGVNIENIDCAKCKLRCRQTTIKPSGGGKSPARELKMDKMTKQEQIEKMASDKDSIVLTRADYEMLKSLYDTQKGAIMTSSIGDLPLTVEGLRKTVDEIARLNRVETELQELNAKYYNEAKDLRRELKQAREETAKEIFYRVVNICRKEIDFQDGTINTQLEPLYFGIINGCDFVMYEVKRLAKQYGVEVEE